MAGREWLLACTVGLGVGLLSGCSFLPKPPSPPLPEQVRRPDPPTETPAAPGNLQPSEMGLVEWGQGAPGQVVGRPERPFFGPFFDGHLDDLDSPVAKGPAVKTAAGAASPAPDPEPRATVGDVQPVDLKPEEPLVEALRCFLNKRPAEAVELLRHYDKANQEALLALLPLAVRLTEGNLDKASPEELAAAVEQLQSLTLAFGRRAAMRIDKLCFCREIRRFGVYEPLPDACPAFRAPTDGRRGELIRVYAEVRNFSSEAQPPYYVTQLASTVRIYPQGKQGEPVWWYDFHVQPDRSRTRRQDYFINYEFCVPSNLPPGHYTLWIEVKDKLSQPPRTARRSLDFQVTAGGTVRGPHGEPSVAVREGVRD
jgi:hypothetical protein